MRKLRRERVRRNLFGQMIAAAQSPDGAAVGIIGGLMDLAKLSREDMIVGGLGIFLIIDLLFLPWYSINFLGVSLTITATSSPYSIEGVLALAVDIAFVLDLA